MPRFPPRFQFLRIPKYYSCGGDFLPRDAANPARSKLLDVHPPHGPIHTLKDFFIHLLTITIGLLIALGLEATVEWLHHRHLAQEARENILQEIHTNQQSVSKYLGQLAEAEKSLDGYLSRADERLHGRPLTPQSQYNGDSLTVLHSAWDSASTTGAISAMSYDEVKRYSTLYNDQGMIASITERQALSIFDALYFIQRMEADKLSKAELESGKRVIQKAIFNLQLCEGPTHGLDARYTRFLNQTN
jgi:hypothetical protein